jgi:exonuclease III
MPRTFAASLAVAVLASAAPAGAEPVRVATWNIEHLRAENATGAVPRDDADYAALGALAEELDADIVALQEVDGPAAAARVFDPVEYAFFFSDRNNPQRTGFAVRRGIEVVADEDFTALALDGSVRRGTDITVRVGGQDVRLLSVHLKSSCFDDDLDADNRHCRKLKQQVPILEGWIDERTREGVPFVVLGDFNRRFDAEGDEFFPEIDDGEPAGLDLIRVTEGLTSECLGGRFPVYIDHIVLDEQAAAFLIPGSFLQVDISEEAEEAFRLSDHCPIAVDLDVVGPGEPDVRARARALFDEIRALVRETNEKVDELNRLIPELRDGR